jgi:hypothetical protein
MDVALRVEVAEEVAHAGEDVGDEGLLLVLGVGAVDDLDLDPDAGPLLRGQRGTAHEPMGWVDAPDRDGGEFRLLAKTLRGGLHRNGGDAALEVGNGGVGRDQDGDDGHGFDSMSGDDVHPRPNLIIRKTPH